MADFISVDDFWIMFREGKRRLDQLMDRMEDFYRDRELSRSTRIGASQILEGVYCAAPYGEDRDWHRAKVLSIKGIGTVKVFYMDYGTRADVKTEDLRFLRRDFAKLPAQAISARSAGIR